MASIATNTAFGVVTVMDVKVYGMDTKISVNSAQKSIEDVYKDKLLSRKDFNDQILALLEPNAAQTPLCTLDHLTVATLSTDGPSITINGGKYNNPLIKYGKTARCEMTDALGQMDALVALGGADYIDDSSDANKAKGIAVTDKFGAPVLIVGDSFVVDQKTGKHVPVKVILYQFLPDSTPSFAFDSGNAATFDLNGDLLAVEFKQAESEECGESSGNFFALIFDTCELGNFKKVPVIIGTGVTLAPNTLARFFDQTSGNLVPVDQFVIEDGTTLQLTVLDSNQQPLDSQDSYRGYRDNKLYLWGGAARWDDVSFIQATAA